jgi:aromatic ring hydroxylase
MSLPDIVAASKQAAREYLDSPDDGREIWIHGERVNKITEHPAFQNCARMIALFIPCPQP